jgi:hypothetical protein
MSMQTTSKVAKKREPFWSKTDHLLRREYYRIGDWQFLQKTCRLKIDFIPIGTGLNSENRRKCLKICGHFSIGLPEKKDLTHVPTFELLHKVLGFFFDQNSII